VLQAAMNDMFPKVFADATLKPFFQGMFGSRTDFTSAANTASIADSYAQFLGTDLGCSDNSVPKYTATNPPPDMKAVHAGMNIQKAQFDAFNNLILAEFTSFTTLGVGMSSANIAKTSAFLNAAGADICASCQGFQGQSLCEKWTQASPTFSADQINGQTKLVTAIVTATFTSFTADHTLIAFFNGTLPCNSRDFINNGINQGVLVNQLVAFFGSAGVLGCTQPSFPQYTGQTDMGILHQNMPISKAIFDFFNQQLVNAIKQQNVASDADIQGVQALLASPGITVICNQNDCNSPHGTWQKQCSDAVPVFPANNNNNNVPPPVGGVGDATAPIVSALAIALAALSTL